MIINGREVEEIIITDEHDGLICDITDLDMITTAGIKVEYKSKDMIAMRQADARI